MTNEKQKKTTEEFRSNWDNIFKKKKEQKEEQPNDEKSERQAS